MQPNEQKQYSQTPPPNGSGYVSPLGSNVPEYLHMEPVVQQRSRKKVTILLGALLIIVILLGAGAFVLQRLQSVPPERFNRAIQNMMSEKYIKQDYVLLAGDKQLRSVESSTDYSQANAPVTRAEYLITSANETKSQVQQESEVVALNDKIYIRIGEKTDKSLIGGLNKNTWYESLKQAPNQAINNFGASDVVNSLNTSHGLFIRGVESQDVRGSILAYIQRNDTYRIVEHKNEKINDVNSTVYTVECDTEKIRKLNAELSELKGTSLPYMYKFPAKTKSSTVRIDVWVNESTDKIIQISSHKTENDVTVNEVTKFTYPNDLSIKVPVDAVLLKNPV